MRHSPDIVDQENGTQPDARSRRKFGRVRQVTAHEIGHTIGLADVNYQTLMAGNTPLRGGIYYPTNDEITGINRLY